jgi:hypothetical protein
VVLPISSITDRDMLPPQVSGGSASGEQATPVESVLSIACRLSEGPDGVARRPFEQEVIGTPAAGKAVTV